MLTCWAGADSVYLHMSVMLHLTAPGAHKYAIAQPLQNNSPEGHFFTYSWGPGSRRSTSMQGCQCFLQEPTNRTQNEESTKCLSRLLRNTLNHQRRMRTHCLAQVAFQRVYLPLKLKHKAYCRLSTFSPQEKHHSNCS